MTARIERGSLAAARWLVIAGQSFGYRCFVKLTNQRQKCLSANNLGICR
jgi:hypothetical protein